MAPERIRKWEHTSSANRRKMFCHAPLIFGSTSTISRFGECSLPVCCSTHGTPHNFPAARCQQKR